MSIYTHRQNAAVAHRTVLTARGRRVRFAFIVIALAAAAVYFLSAQSADATSTQANVTFAYETVMPGDTLWSIAERVAPNRDPRDWIADAVALNGLTSSNIAAGTRIALPGN